MVTIAIASTLRNLLRRQVIPDAIVGGEIAIGAWALRKEVESVLPNSAKRRN